MSVLRTAHQFVPTIAYGDAVSNDCFELQRLFWSWQVRSDVFAEEAKARVRGLVGSWDHVRRLRRRDSFLLLHLGMGNAAYDELLEHRARKILVYHNITPAEYFAGLNPSHEEWARRGREQLARLAKVCELGIGDSEYNRLEMAAAGFARTTVVPILVDWSALDVEPDAAVERALSGRRVILAVGQIAPQKAVHDVVAGFAEYRRSDSEAHLCLVGSTSDSGAYLDRVRGDIARLGVDGSVTITGQVTTEELVAYYRGASAFVTLSEHEGFCVPLLEAMRFDLPIVAHAGGAIPETAGGAGIVLESKRPGEVAGALERALRDKQLRWNLVTRGRARLADFSRERVAERVASAFALLDARPPRARPRRVAVLSSAAPDGIRPYALAVEAGLRASGHDVALVGVAPADTQDLFAKLEDLPRDLDAIIVEHEFGLFRDIPFIRALFALRRRGVPVVLSLHELEPEKFHHYRRLVRGLHYRQTRRWWLEVGRVLWVALQLALRFATFRAVAALFGALPDRLVFHSDRSGHWIDLLTSNFDKIEEAPLLVRPLEGVALPNDAAERRALRARLGLPPDAFLFVSPGFFFKRKRLIEVIAAAPRDSVVVLSGTRSLWDEEYFDEVRDYVRSRGLANVVINTEWNSMGDYVAASDCVVLYYESIFQSGVATQAIWAGLPCIFSDLPGFRVYEGAGLFALTTEDLRGAMQEIRRPEVYEGLRRGIRFYRRMLAAERQAQRYVAGLPRSE